MLPQIDIQMPVRRGGFVVSEVVERWLLQDADLSLYVDAGPDLVLEGTAEAAIELLSSDPEHAGLMRLRMLASAKRNRLFERGRSPYVYLADPDVLLPPQPIMGQMVEALDADSTVGAVGLLYIDEYDGHVGAGAMLLRRSSLATIGTLRHLAKFCECDYIKHRLEAVGQRVLALPSDVVHFRDDYAAGYADYPLQQIAVQPDGQVPVASLREFLSRQGAPFRLGFDLGNGA